MLFPGDTNEMKQHQITDFTFVPRLPDNDGTSRPVPSGGLYMGNEFCGFLMPTAAQVRDGLQSCDAAGIPFVLVLPWCPQHALERARSLLKLLPTGSEVVFNDWGLLTIIQEYNLIPIAGRLLSPHSADPRAMSFKQFDDPEFSRLLSSTPGGTRAFGEILINHGVHRIEFDNPEQGLDIKLAKGIKGSLYYPYVYITTGRVCMTRYSLYGEFLPPTRVCRAPCRRILIRRKILSFDKNVFLKGNTHFYVNPILPDTETLTAMGIDRLIFMPNFPF